MRQTWSDFSRLGHKTSVSTWFILTKFYFAAIDFVFAIQDPDGETENPGKAFLKSESRTSVTFKKKHFLYFSQFFHGNGLAKSQPLQLVDSLGQKL